MVRFGPVWKSDDTKSNSPSNCNRNLVSLFEVLENAMLSNLAIAEGLRKASCSLNVSSWNLWLISKPVAQQPDYLLRAASLGGWRCSLSSKCSGWWPAPPPGHRVPRRFLGHCSQHPLLDYIVHLAGNSVKNLWPDLKSQSGPMQNIAKVSDKTEKKKTCTK